MYLRFGGLIIATRLFSLAVLILAVFGVGKVVSARQVSIPSRDEHFSEMRLESVQIEARSLGQLLSRLSLSHKMQIGLEVALGDQLGDQLGDYSINFKAGSLKDFLTKLVTQHEEYQWEIKDDVVNVFPKDNYRDVVVEELLSTEIGRFSVKQKTSCWDLENALADTP